MTRVSDYSNWVKGGAINCQGEDWGKNRLGMCVCVCVHINLEFIGEIETAYVSVGVSSCT